MVLLRCVYDTFHASEACTSCGINCPGKIKIEAYVGKYPIIPCISRSVRVPLCRPNFNTINVWDDSIFKLTFLLTWKVTNPFSSPIVVRTMGTILCCVSIGFPGLASDLAFAVCGISAVWCRWNVSETWLNYPTNCGGFWTLYSGVEWSNAVDSEVRETSIACVECLIQ